MDENQQARKCPIHGFIGDSTITWTALTTTEREEPLRTEVTFCMHCFVEYLKRAGIEEVTVPEPEVRNHAEEKTEA